MFMTPVTDARRRVRFPRIASGALATVGLTTALVACTGGADSEAAISTTEPAAAVATTPSSIVQPMETYRPWETPETEPTQQPEPSVPGCEISTIARDVGEEESASQMILGFCDGRWAHVSLDSAGLDGWAVRPEDRWGWLQADGHTTDVALSSECYLAETIEAHSPVPDEAQDDLSICGPNDVLLEESDLPRD